MFNKMNVAQFNKVKRVLALVACALVLSPAPASAQPAGAPLYLADGGGAVSLADVDGKPVLADAKDAKAQWTYAKDLLQFKNVASGNCLAAVSPVDGIGVTMAACADKNRYQQWKRQAGAPGLVVLGNVATARCLTADGTGAGARLYQEVCSLTGIANTWAAGGRTLAIISGNDQRLGAAQPVGVPFVVKVIGENGQPAAGVPVNFYVRSARAKNYLAFEGGGETATATSGADGIATSPKIKLAEPGEFEIRFTGSASLDDSNTIVFEGTCLC
ncbi:Ricin-type beta-trefoil lectin domain-containing protein [Amycolatopsis xylanica]|uniref:Ricin-type beta-trefoil lectin domain-containing protein n=1 Tax=Amycolatopsis xylanica TaxID=589385 RepID=A0A1H3SKR2_9PSEU|nr:RICIN domain-containing protein [Amycolatopsis xylanica]SDZ38327.1 Ricin-type beta-trefoil lectin domain-containing protein [Amycolatopsis xylanica]